MIPQSEFQNPGSKLRSPDPRILNPDARFEIRDSRLYGVTTGLIGSKFRFSLMVSGSIMEG
jgi:hypothetical protein